MKRSVKLLLVIFVLFLFSDVYAIKNPFENLSGKEKLNIAIGVSWIAFIGGTWAVKELEEDKLRFIEKNKNQKNLDLQLLSKQRKIDFFTFVALAGGLGFFSASVANVCWYFKKKCNK